MIEDEVKLDGAEDETASSENTALIELDTSGLNQESLEIINRIIAEQDVEKTKDLTYLFNINQNKKTMVRVDKLSSLQDVLIDEYTRRLKERPDEISNQEMLQSIKTIHDLIERGTKQVNEVNEQPLITVNQQNNTINVGNPNDLNRESRKKVSEAVQSILDSLMAPQQSADVIDLTEENTEDGDGH